MRILIACEFSGITRQAFAALGHDVWSCDLNDTEIEGKHIIGDVRDVLGEGWDMVIASPPTNNIVLIQTIWHCDIARIAIDNPPTQLSKVIGNPSQILNPWMFGLPSVNVTCLWLKNLPLIPPKEKKKGENTVIMPHKKSFNKDPKAALRMNPVVAKAMANAWGAIDESHTVK